MTDIVGKGIGKVLEQQSPSTLLDKLKAYGVDRRDFMKYCTMMAATLALPVDQVPRIAKALQSEVKPRAIYMEFQDCAGNSEAVLRTSHPDVATIVLDILSWNYHETVMYAAGHQAEEALEQTIEEGGYLLFVEGSVPLGSEGVYCTIGGRTALDILQTVSRGAAAIINMGNCACFGNLPAASPNPTGAVGVPSVISDRPVINMAGCPVNAVNVSALVTYYVTYNALPEVDRLGRPLFAYGARIHDTCQRRAYFDAGLFVEQWGDAGHEQGYCLYKVGCKGPATYHNCGIAMYNERTSWPVAAGHGCIGCSEPAFFDRLAMYQRLPEVEGFGIEANAELIAAGIVGATALGVAAHAVGSAIRGRQEETRPEPRGETPTEENEPKA
jgi:hydrogenase small subunit